MYPRQHLETAGENEKARRHRTASLHGRARSWRYRRAPVGTVGHVVREASVVSTVAIALEAGVLLALSYAATNRLWLPIGLHLGWNFAEGSIFGTAVSGHAMSGGVLRGELHGPAILSGGDFGPEASVVAVLVCLAASVVFAGFVLRRGRVV